MGIIRDQQCCELKKKKTVDLPGNRPRTVFVLTDDVYSILPLQSFLYGMAGLVAALLVWFNIFYRSDVLRVANRTELIRE